MSTHQTGPFGEELSGLTNPWNTLDKASFGYVGSAQKLSEVQFVLRPIQMGERVYMPGIGRFLQVDPILGGTPNNYVYPTDPVNEYDLNGQWISIVVKLLFRGGGGQAAKKVAPKQAVRKVVKQQVKSTPKKVTSNAATTKNGQSKTYQVYTKTNKKTGQVYTGRTSGNRSAQQNVASRNVNHHMNTKGYGEPNLLFDTSSKSAARGGEQFWINKFGGAQSTGGTSGNAINGISANNPKADEYIGSFLKELGN